MVERTLKKQRKSPMTRSGQRCRPSSKSRQVRMRLKLEVASLQEKYGVDYKHYWVDEKAGKIFCLVEAPSADLAAPTACW